MSSHRIILAVLIAATLKNWQPTLPRDCRPCVRQETPQREARRGPNRGVARFRQVRCGSPWCRSRSKSSIAIITKRCLRCSVVITGSRTATGFTLPGFLSRPAPGNRRTINSRSSPLSICFAYHTNGPGPRPICPTLHHSAAKPSSARHLSLINCLAALAMTAK